MRESRRTLKTLSILAIVAYLLCFMPAPPALAGWVTTGEGLNGPKAKLLTLVERSDVRDAIASMGVDPGEASRRVAAMTDAEAQSALDRLGDMKAGGEIGVIVGAALLVFLVLLLTDIAGLTNVFSFVKHK